MTLVREGVITPEILQSLLQHPEAKEPIRRFVDALTAAADAYRQMSPKERDVVHELTFPRREHQ
jgi:hypothetical protein